MAQASLDKDQRRSFRDEAIRGLNSIATEVAIDRVSTRAGSDVVQKFFKKLCAQVTADSLDALRAERTKWVNHGGCELDELSLQTAERRLGPPSEEKQQPAGKLPSHSVVAESFYTPGVAAGKSGFRLCARAFMLTYNSLAFVLSPALYQEFEEFVKQRATDHGATYWSATLEKSDNSNDIGRVHFHAYLSWHDKNNPTIDHGTTDAWVFNSVRPRVDANTERRGESESESEGKSENESRSDCESDSGSESESETESEGEGERESESESES